MTLPLLRPGWAAPVAVGAAMSLREGGLSAAPWCSLNLGRAVGDEPAAVAGNRQRFTAAIGATPVWLRQVHGANVLHLSDAGERDEPADAAWTAARGVACTVLVADCLPVLMCSSDGRVVAAAHAGWRGLAAGVLEATLAALNEGAGVTPGEVLAWLGPCIGAQAFEVGADVLQAFGRATAPQDHDAFVFSPRPEGSPRWRADLVRLARQRLAAAGVQRVAADGRCTVEDVSAFFSYRRDGVTGRHAAAVWRV
ncbi:MAG: peptidoglycan editing factor PgeF [Rubrivivax sp.]|nr:peptidoglycan editing factor PgeF [Rubrivivax sp.]